MGILGKRIIVYTMMWVLLVMVVSQVYDNVTGRGMPAPRPAAATPEPTVEPNADVTHLADLQACVASDPKNLQCTLDLASFYYDAGMWQASQAAYESAVRLDPHNVTTLLRLAGTYIYQSNFTQAIPTLQEAASLQPDSPEIHLLLGLALSKTDPPRKEDAITEWRKVVSLAPGTDWANQASGYIAEAGGH
ncbi:MAG: tetratricopeptide repeat protein [Chloroflexia bacterium]